MAPSKKPQKGDSKSVLLLIILLIGAGVFYFFGTQEEKKTPPKVAKSISAYSEKANELVNKHLSMTSKAVELEQRKRNYENQFSTPQLGDSVVFDPKDKKEYGVDHSADTNESNAYNDLNRYPHELRATDPDRIIRNQLVDQDKAQEYEQAYREEYARQFVENARRNGYEVRLNSDYVVISVKKIRNPSNYNLGPQAR